MSRMRVFCDSMALLVAGTGVALPSAGSMNVNMALFADVPAQGLRRHWGLLLRVL